MAGQLCIFGGTFNPVHRGHLAMACAARDLFGLDRVLWVPAGRPPHKPLPGGATLAQRLEMVALALAGEAKMELSRVDAERSGPAYAIDTLRLLAHAYPGASWSWLIGEDSLRDLGGWYRAEALIPSCRWLIAPRPNGSQLEQTIAELRRRFGGAYSVLEGFDSAISSTEVRERLHRHLPVAHLLPAAVAEYIRAEGLYGSQ